MKYQGVKISKYTQFLGIYFAVAILGVVDIGFGSALRYIALIPIIVSFPNAKNIRVGKYLKRIIVYYLFAIISICWTINFEESANTAIAFSSLILLFYSAVSQDYKNEEYDYLLKCLLFSSRLSLFVSWLFGKYSDGRLIVQDGIINEDPNYLCAYFYFGIGYCVCKIFTLKRKKENTFYIAELLLYIYTIFATGSRGGLLGALIVAAIIFVKSANIKNVKGLISLVITLCVLYVLVGKVTSEVDQDAMDRFTIEAITESDGSGRYEIWEDAYNAFLSYDPIHTLVGHGMGASRSVARLYNFNRVNVMHNVFLENLLGLGLLGVVLYIICLHSLFKLSAKSSLALAFLGGMFALTLSTSVLYLKPYWNCMIFIVISNLYINRNESD